MTPFRITLAGLSLVGLTLWPAWQARRLLRSRGLLERQTRSLAAARAESGRILRLRKLPQRAAETAPDEEYLHRYLEALAREVGLPAAAIRSIRPAEPARLGRSAYLESVTTVEINPLTLRQLVELLFRLREGGGGFRLKALDLVQNEREAGVWEATLEFAFLIFRPAAEPATFSSLFGFGEPLARAPRSEVRTRRRGNREEFEIGANH